MKKTCSANLSFLKVALWLLFIFFSPISFAQCPGSPPAGINCVASAGSKEISAHSQCRSVTNNHASGRAVMIPTLTSLEWASFYNSPPASVSVGACAPKYLAVSHATSPYVTIYNINDWSKVANPSTLPAGNGYGVSYNHNGSMLAVAHTSSPYVTIYNTSTWAKLANPSVLPDGNGRAVAFNHNGTSLAVGDDSNNSYSIYDFPALTKAVSFYAGSPTYGVGFSHDSSYSAAACTAAPYFFGLDSGGGWASMSAATPPNSGYGVAYNHNNTLLAVAHTASPYVTIYNVSGWTKLSNPGTLPTGDGKAVAFNPAGTLLAVGHATSPYITIYNTSTWAKLTNPSTLPTGTVNGVTFNDDGSLMAVAHDNSPYVTIYNTSDWSKVANPSTLPAGTGTGVSFSN